MKKKFYLVAVITALLMSACSNDVVPVESTAEAALEVTIASASTRATGTLPTPTDEDVVTRVTVGLFKPDGSTDAISEGTLDADKKITVSGTAGVRTVLVACNAPANAFKGVTTIDGFRSTVLSLTQDKSLLPMSGEGSAAVTLIGGGSVSTSVTVARLVSRVQLTSVKSAFEPNGPYANASFVLDKVFLYRVKSKSQVGFVSPATVVTTDLVDAWDGVSTAPTASADLIDVLSPEQTISATAYTTPYYFYAFENYFPNDGTTTLGITNTNKTTATKLVLSGYFIPDAVHAPGTKYYVFYPAVINRSQSGTKITGKDGDDNTADLTGISNTGLSANNIYSVEATIKSRGVDSPADFMEPADLELTVEIAPWKLNVTQQVDF